MSILEKIEKRKREGRLFVLPLQQVNESPVRTILVTPKLYKQLTGADWKTADEAIRLSKLRGDLEHFIKNGQISMHLDPSQRKQTKAAQAAYMGLLKKPENGIFDIRSRDPKPGLRVLGGYAHKDVFVAIECHPRSRRVPWLGWPPLKDGKSKAWKEAIGKCRKKWKDLFGQDTPLTGSDPDVFLTGNKSLV